MIRTIIIEDEEKKRSLLRQMLSKIRNDVEIIGEASDVISGKQLIVKEKPDLVLLDIQLTDGTGFDLLEQLTSINFKIIFITAYTEYAVKAFDFSAVDYVLKPVSLEKLNNAIDKVVHVLLAEYNLKINTLLSNHHSNNDDEKRLFLRTESNIHVIKLINIIRCESDGSYCNFFLTDGKKLTISKPMGEFASLLSDFGFFRVHKSHLVNIKRIRRIEKSEGGSVIMESDDRIPISSSRKEDFFDCLKNIGLS